jgi:hypothetical protein
MYVDALARGLRFLEGTFGPSGHFTLTKRS